MEINKKRWIHKQLLALQTHKFEFINPHLKLLSFTVELVKTISWLKPKINWLDTIKVIPLAESICHLKHLIKVLPQFKIFLNRKNELQHLHRKTPFHLFMLKNDSQ